MRLSRNAGTCCAPCASTNLPTRRGSRTCSRDCGPVRGLAGMGWLRAKSIGVLERKPNTPKQIQKAEEARLNAKTITALIKAHADASMRERREWDRYYAWYKGEFWDEVNQTSSPERWGSDRDFDDSVNLETNYPYAFVDTMISNVCPTNPQVTINAADPDLDEVAKAREKLANDFLRRNKTHSKLWDISATAAICGWGVSKTVWRAKLRRAVSILIDPRNFYWERTVPFEETSYCIEATPVKLSTFQKRQQPGPGGEVAMYDPEVASAATVGDYPKWLSGPGDRQGVGHVSKMARDTFKWIVVYEVYDFEDDKYYHMLLGNPQPLYESDTLPYRYVRNPYDLVVFNRDLRESVGMSDVKLIRSAQERLNEIDSLELEHAHTSIPVTMLNPSLLSDPEAAKTALTTSDAPGGVVEIEMSNNQLPLSAAVQYTATPNLSPSFDKMRDRTTGIIEFTLGIPQYSRGVVGAADIATEVSLANTSTRTRNGRRIKVLEDLVASIAKKGVGLMAEFLTPAKDQDPEEFMVPVRDINSKTSELLSLAELGFDDPKTFEEDWWLEYEAVPYSPTEDHRLVTLQKLQTFLPVLLGNPNINQGAFMAKLLDLLGMSELYQKSAPAAPAAPAQMPAAPPEDNIAAGGLPEGHGDAAEAVLPPGARQLASQPKL